MGGTEDQRDILLEISMNTGVGIDMDQTLYASLSTMLRTLHCDQAVVLELTNRREHPWHAPVFSLPVREFNHKTMLDIVEKMPLYPSTSGGWDEEQYFSFVDILPRTCAGEGEAQHTVLELPGYGLLVLSKCGSALEPSLLHKLKPLLAKLAQSCLTQQRLQEFEEDLRESEVRFRQLSNATWEAVVIHENGCILEANEQYYELFEYAPEELQDINALELTVSPQSMEYLRCQLSSGNLGPYEVIGLKKSGAEFHMEIQVKLMNYYGRIVRVAAIRDITERKRAEHEMRRLERLLKNVINSMPSVIVAVDSYNIVMLWNRGAEQATGIQASKAEGKALEIVYPSLASELDSVDADIRMGIILEVPKAIRQEKEHVQYQNVTIFPLEASTSGGAVIRVDDVTERVRMEEVLIQSEKMRSLGGLAAGMAHEINNPLAAVVGYAQIMHKRLKSGLPKNSRVARECGTTIEAIEKYTNDRGVGNMLLAVGEAGRRAAAIVENMLSFSRDNETKRALCDITQLVDTTLSLANADFNLDKKYDFKKINIERSYQPGLPLVMCEASKLQQVLINLFRNAAQAMDEKQYVSGISPQLCLRAYLDKDWIVLEVKDNGPGMAEEICKHIFEPFYTTKEPGVGTGLGLSVSYFIVCQGHGGEMSVDSSEGHWTRFTLKLPVTIDENSGR